MLFKLLADTHTYQQQQKQALETAFPADKGWRAQWALLQEARRRGLRVEREEDGLRAHALRALKDAAVAGGHADEGKAVAAALLLLEGGGRKEGELDVGEAVLSLIRCVLGLCQGFCSMHTSWW